MFFLVLFLFFLGKASSNIILLKQRRQLSGDSQKQNDVQLFIQNRHLRTVVVIARRPLFQDVQTLFERLEEIPPCGRTVIPAAIVYVALERIGASERLRAACAFDLGLGAVVDHNVASHVWAVPRDVVAFVALQAGTGDDAPETEEVPVGGQNVLATGRWQEVRGRGISDSQGGEGEGQGSGRVGSGLGGPTAFGTLDRGAALGGAPGRGRSGGTGWTGS